MEQMPTWAPPTPPQDSNDSFVDYSMAFAYETSTMTESQLPPVYVPRESKRAKLDNTAQARNKQHKVRKDDVMNIPRSLFDKPSPAILKLRRELKIQKLKGALNGGPDIYRLRKTLQIIGANVNINAPMTLQQQAHVSKAPPALLAQLQNDSQLNWNINEDWAILNIIQFLQELPLNLMILSPGHIPNWDFVSDAVNSIASNFRSAKLCRHHYETIILEREENKLNYDPSPRKTKRAAKQSTNQSTPNVNINTSSNQTTQQTPKPSQGRPMRTSHIYLQDGNYSFSQLYHSRFETIKTIANKKQPTVRPRGPHQNSNNNPVKNTRHVAVLDEYGVNYDDPSTPLQLAANKAEKIERERLAKEKAKLPQPQDQPPVLPDVKQLARQKQLQRQSSTPQIITQQGQVIHPRPQILQSPPQFYV